MASKPGEEVGYTAYVKCKVGPPSQSACKKSVYQVVPRQNIICRNECDCVSVYSTLFLFTQIPFVFASQGPICNWLHYLQIILAQTERTLIKVIFTLLLILHLLLHLSFLFRTSVRLHLLFCCCSNINTDCIKEAASMTPSSDLRSTTK